MMSRLVNKMAVQVKPGSWEQQEAQAVQMAYPVRIPPRHGPHNLPSAGFDLRELERALVRENEDFAVDEE